MQKIIIRYLGAIKQLEMDLLKGEKVFVIIEEPEAHLYPYLQKDIIEFVSYFMNKTGSTVFVTTHSPYVLTSINTLYCAGKAVQEFPQSAKKVDEIMGEDTIIHPKALSAYKIEENGEFTDLCDNEMNEVNTELIDEVSEQKIPKGIEPKERALWQELIKYRNKPAGKVNPVHYVKVTPSSRYSDNKQKIICSSASPIPMPYTKPE